MVRIREDVLRDFATGPGLSAGLADAKRIADPQRQVRRAGREIRHHLDEFDRILRR